MSLEALIEARNILVKANINAEDRWCLISPAGYVFMLTGKSVLRNGRIDRRKLGRLIRKGFINKGTV